MTQANGFSSRFILERSFVVLVHRPFDDMDMRMFCISPVGGHLSLLDVFFQGTQANEFSSRFILERSFVVLVHRPFNDMDMRNEYVCISPVGFKGHLSLLDVLFQGAQANGFSSRFMLHLWIHRLNMK